MKRFFIIVGLTGFLITAGARFSFAGEIDILLNKLVEKGILTDDEARQIRVETKEAVKKEITQAKSETLPMWIQTMKLKGDLRIRYQMDRTDQPAETFNYRHRGRFRFRLGIESKINSKVLVAAGLATGITTAGQRDAARSTNQTFQDAFSKKPIALDYAYGQYMPFNWATITAGKMKNPLWEPTNLLWDTDINPEGGAFQFNKRVLADNLEFFANTGVLVIDEGTADSRDPMLYVVQTGAKYNLLDSVSLKGAFSYYNFSNVKHRYIEGGSYDSNAATVNAMAYGNSRENIGATARLRYGYATLTPAAEVTVKKPFHLLGLKFINVPQISFFGEYVQNPLVSRDNTGYIGGLRFGSEKIEDFGNWQFMYNFAMLGRDSIPDFLPDLDRYEGSTGIRSHNGNFQFGLGKNTYLAATYYQSWREVHPRVREHLVQVDWNMKF